MSDKLREVMRRHDEFMRGSAREILKTVNRYYYGKHYIAYPGSSWWVRLKVWYANLKDHMNRSETTAEGVQDGET